MLEALSHYLETLILDYIVAVVLGFYISPTAKVIRRLAIYSRHLYKIMAILHSFAKPSLIRGSGCNTFSYSGLANVDTHKIMFIFLLTPFVFMFYGFATFPRSIRCMYM